MDLSNLSKTQLIQLLSYIKEPECYLQQFSVAKLKEMIQKVFDEGEWAKMRARQWLSENFCPLKALHEEKEQEILSLQAEIELTKFEFELSQEQLNKKPKS